MRNERQKKVVLILALVFVFAITVLVSGCSQQELTRKETRFIPKSKSGEKLNLQEVLSETSLTLNSSLRVSSEDPFLITLSGLRPKKTIIKEEGPVTVSIVYPPTMSLIDRTIKITAIAESKYKINKVEFFVDGERVKTLTSPPYEIEFNPETQAKSKHTVKVVARSGKYTDSDQITIFNVIKGSLVIYPWEPVGGNIPYSYVNSYFAPDGKVIKEAFFMSYDKSSFYIDFKTNLPGGLGYLFAVLNINPRFLASEITSAEGTSTMGSGYLKGFFYDWSRYRFYEKPFFTASHSADGQQTQVVTHESQLDMMPDYEVYEFGNPKKFKGLQVPGFPYYAFNPFTKEFRIRIYGIGPVKFSLQPMVLTYYAIYDYDKPIIKIRDTKIRDRSPRVDFYVSEPVFLQVYCYNAVKRQIASFRLAKPEGWNEVLVYPSGTAYVKLKATDIAGHSTTTGFIRLP